MAQERMKQTEVGEIPESWEVNIFEKSIKSIKVKRNIKIPKSNYLEYGQFPIIDQGQSYISGWTNDESTLFDEELPAIIFGDHTRVFKYLEKPFALGADGTKLIIPTSSYNAKFFYYFLLNKNIPNKGYNRHYNLLKDILILSPPLSEQKKIAAVLSNIQQNIDAKEALIRVTKELKKSMMNHLFTYGTKGEKTKQTEIGEIPESWEIKYFSEICTYTMGKTPTRNKSVYWKNGIMPWLTILDMKQGEKITNTKEKVSKVAMQDCFTKKIVSTGTLLMSFKLTIGRTCFAGCDLVHNEAIIAIYPKKELDKLYLGYYLPSIDYSIHQDRQLKGNTLNKSKINKLKIPLPPLPEQKKIASILSKIDERIQNYEEQKSALQALFKSMLNKLMTGKIRVHQLDIDVSGIE